MLLHEDLEKSTKKEFADFLETHPEVEGDPSVEFLSAPQPFDKDANKKRRELIRSRNVPTASVVLEEIKADENIE